MSAVEYLSRVVTEEEVDQSPLKVKEKDRIVNMLKKISKFNKNNALVEDITTETKIMKRKAERLQKEFLERDNIFANIPITDTRKNIAEVYKDHYQRIGEFTIDAQSRINEYKERCFLTTEANLNLMKKLTVMRERYQLMQCKRGKKTRTQLKERKQELESKMRMIKEAYEKIVQLDVQRQQKEPSITLQQYLNNKLKAGHEKILALRENNFKYSDEISQVTRLIDERRQQIEDIQKAIQQKSEAPVEESCEYMKIVEKNKQLKDKLDCYLISQDHITEQMRVVLNEIEDEKRNRKENMNADSITMQEREICASLAQLEYEYDERVLREPIDDEIVCELETQIMARDLSFAHLQVTTKQLRQQYDEELRQVNGLENEMQQITEQNKHIFKMLTNVVQQTTATQDGATVAS